MITVVTAEGAPMGEGVGQAAVGMEGSEGSREDVVRTAWGMRACEGPGAAAASALPCASPRENQVPANST